MFKYLAKHCLWSSGSGVGGAGWRVVATNGYKNADKCFRQNTNFTSLTASGVFSVICVALFLIDHRHTVAQWAASA